MSPDDRPSPQAMPAASPHAPAKGPAPVGPAIEVSGLVKNFGDGNAVDGISFSVPRGTILGLLGPNGAGKTTTLHLLLGLVTPTAGTIRIFGLDMPRDRHAILARVNFTSSYISMPDNLRVWENLKVFAMLYGVRGAEAKTEELLRLLEIEHLRDARTGALSSGQLTRLNLCKALLNDPEILFLDEPTASLDPDIAERVRLALRRIQSEQGTTMIYTSHNMHEVEELCDEVVFITKGRIAARGTPAEVVRMAHSESLERLFISIARGGDIFARPADEAEAEPDAPPPDIPPEAPSGRQPDTPPACPRERGDG
ncbi:ABC transporter related protein [Desulfovibrio sp. X2]|uniref:ABC transporter ATP-binding protein n=1 Tax=Desulfovibrio sp. X2 TaxID=941449 RepID=UPI000358BB73|nr:ABC transporter ATP-binding protein [Desulfovibrio sp. X2]EPR44500.1 ABC transporter related protein [Desulfovibrio sp. X2]